MTNKGDPADLHWVHQHCDSPQAAYPTVIRGFNWASSMPKAMKAADSFKRLVVEAGGGKEKEMMEEMAIKRGMFVVEATAKQILRKKAFVDQDTLVVGNIPFVRAALQQMGKQMPKHTPYPVEHAELMHRKVRLIPSLRWALIQLENGPMFIKPADGWKRFTGFVAHTETDHRFQGASLAKPVWVSEPVEFIEEWRFYVVGGFIINFENVSDKMPLHNFYLDICAIQRGVAKMHSSGQYPSAYVIDFGLLKDGRTALVEMNDGFSFGAYDTKESSGDSYWAVTATRWRELIS
jgi:hypothetical protein